MRKKYIILSSIIIALLGFFFLSELLLPQLVAKKIASELKNKFKGEAVVTTVSVQAWPAFKLLLGQADKVQVEVEELAFNNLVIDQLRVTLQNLRLEFLQQGLEAEQILNGAQVVSGRLIISEESLAQYMNREAFLPLEKPRVVLSKGQAFVIGKALILNTSVELTANFRLKAEGSEIFFSPQDLLVEGLSLPEFIKAPLLERIAFKVALENLPLQMKFQGLTITEGFMEINLTR